MHFDASLLSTLAVLLNTQSVSKTAARLGLSQPTVSRALSELRRMLADPLLVRSGGGMILTTRGAELVGPLAEWAALTATVLQAPIFEPATMDRRFVVASSDYGVLSVILPALARINRIAPGCQVEVVSYSEDMFARLAAGGIDLLVYGRPHRATIARSRRLFTETMSLVVRTGHPLAVCGAGRVDLDRYLAWPHVAVSVGADGYDHVRHCLGDRTVDRHVLVRLPYHLAATEVIGDSDAIVTLPTRAAMRLARKGFVRLDAPAEIHGFDYWALSPARGGRDAGLEWLIEMLSAAGSTDSIGQPAPAEGDDA